MTLATTLLIFTNLVNNLSQTTQRMNHENAFIPIKLITILDLTIREKI